MEIGAVKQAFNNELILLKKSLNQARTQTINKLTRKAKQLTEKKKAPEALQEKFKRKAESAVKEVLIIKKIKARDIGRFIVTHTGKLQDHLNKPQVDENRACARLLLHKALQEKYKTIRNRFSNIPIKDLFMSRQERLKLKKEEKQKQKEKKKKKGKNKVVNAEGDWDVEDINSSIKKHLDNDPQSIDQQDDSDKEEDDSHHSVQDSDEEALREYSELKVVNGSEDEDADSEEKDVDNESQENVDEDEHSDKNEGNEEEEASAEEGLSEQEDSDKDLKTIPAKKENKLTTPKAKETSDKNILSVPKPVEKHNKVKAEKKQKDSNKNKNLNEKIRHKKFKKDMNDAPTETKVVDPFFLTESGGNYMSLAEPRQPDEVKEEHKQGNRKLRRAVMFGHVPKSKLRQGDRFREENRFRNQDNSKFNRHNGFEKPDSRFDKQDSFQKNNNRFNNKSDDNRRPRYNDRNDKQIKEDKPEKLHPSWEAKKKQSGILPFQGKKIVFGDN